MLGFRVVGCSSVDIRGTRAARRSVALTLNLKPYNLKSEILKP